MLQVRKCSPTKPDIKNGEQCFASISLGHSSQCYQRNQCKVRSVTAWKFAVDRDSALTCWDHKLWFANMMNITTQFGFLSFLFFFLFWNGGGGVGMLRPEKSIFLDLPSPPITVHEENYQILHQGCLKCLQLAFQNCLQDCIYVHCCFVVPRQALFAGLIHLGVLKGFKKQPRVLFFSKSPCWPLFVFIITVHSCNFSPRMLGLKCECW